MTWQEGRLDKAQAEIEWIVGWAADYPEKAQIRRVLHRLARDAWLAHMLHYSPWVMGIDEEVLDE